MLDPVGRSASMVRVTALLIFLLALLGMLDCDNDSDRKRSRNRRRSALGAIRLTGWPACAHDEPHHRQRALDPLDRLVQAAQLIGRHTEQL